MTAVPDRVRAPRTIAVVGGGITGLAAAYAVTRLAPETRVVVVEESDRLGGKIRTRPFGDVQIEDGPDAFLARVPGAAQLCRDLGLGPDLVSPRTSKAYFWARDRLRPIPKDTFLGIPTGFASIAASGILSREGLARASLDLVLARKDLPEDPSIAELVSDRFGREVLDRLVEPMLGGIYAGDVTSLSATATMPEVVHLARRRRSLSVALRKHRATTTGKGSVFLTLRGGLERLVLRLAEELKRCDIRTGVRVETIVRGRRGFHLRTPEGVPIAADAVVVTTPAFAAASLIRDVSPDVADLLGGIDYVGVATATLGYDRASIKRPLDGSGFLVPRSEGRFITGCTWMTSKWEHLRNAQHAVIRCSVGHARDDRWMRFTDEEIVARVHSELGEVLGATEPPVLARVVRWERSMPQYTVGHPARLMRIESALRSVPGIELAGAAYRGIGLPACIAQGRAAAERVLAGATG